MPTIRIVTTVAVALPLLALLIGCDEMTPAEARPRSEAIVGEWITANGYVLDIDRDGTATSNDPAFDDLARLGVRDLQWSYDDATDRFRLGATYEGLWFGIEATAQWSGDDRVCFEVAGECGPYWARRGT